VALHRQTDAKPTQARTDKQLKADNYVAEALFDSRALKLRIKGEDSSTNSFSAANRDQP
jgi:hypothetical protein